MSKKKASAQGDKTYNPIDPDQVAENPHLLPYAHTVGGAVIRPEDKGRLKGRAVAAMYEQTDLQFQQIKKQIDLLAEQAKALQDRVRISEEIYQAEISFEPLIGRTYHLYRRANGQALLSMVSPAEWGARPPYTFVATVRMLADHTWEIEEMASPNATGAE
ncbi:MAG: DUF2452 domain-containing protein [Lewinella sp.]|nr:DUF2452 domain-containing protein [Lewinella sp.]